MNIIITNDDGWDAPALKALTDKLSLKHTLWVFAPSSDRSGISSSITLKKAISVKERDDRVWAVSGTPVDCVRVALSDYFNIKPDLFISGINMGPNLGCDLVYSGTAAAAREAVFQGIPALAVSHCNYAPPYTFDTSAQIIADHLETFLSYMKEESYLNINIPGRISPDWKIVETYLSRRSYSREYLYTETPYAGVNFFVNKAPIITEKDELSDYAVTEEGHVSVTPVHIYPEKSV